MCSINNLRTAKQACAQHIGVWQGRPCTAMDMRECSQVPQERLFRKVSSCDCIIAGSVPQTGFMLPRSGGLPNGAVSMLISITRLETLPHVMPGLHASPVEQGRFA